MALDILVVDDEEDIRELICGILQDEGYETRSAGDSDTTLAEIEARRPSLLILDIWLQGSRLDGLELLDIIKQQHPDLPVIIISGHGTIETAVAAIKRGAYDFIGKPFETEQLLVLVSRATETERLRRENEALKEKVGYDDGLTGTSNAINQVRQMIERLGPSGSRVLISGPPGSGKELVARMIHNYSPRSEGPFVVINAATIEPETMEREIFGVEEEGKVTKTGLFEKAHGGTLFIDEVAEMPMASQAKILRLLTDQTFERVGGGKSVRVDVRVVSASNRDLREEITALRFREDLYHRLNVVPIDVPPLSRRSEDIPLLVDQFMRQVAVATGRAQKKVNEDVLNVLKSYEWPGNVRQLRNIVEQIFILSADHEEITTQQLPGELLSGPYQMAEQESQHYLSSPLREAREKFEREYLKAQLIRFQGNISRTAEFVGMERSALHRKLKGLGVSITVRGK
ncbi:MAG: sigma-54-dependent Fis family transcriptional regulator [Kordiimonas sp.]|nr:sigma-54-dependent Fis family transcriptional regulator [Kordiimonas sp.]